jgi:hypothetical protein
MRKGLILQYFEEERESNTRRVLTLAEERVFRERFPIIASPSRQVRIHVCFDMPENCQTDQQSPIKAAGKVITYFSM